MFPDCSVRVNPRCYNQEVISYCLIAYFSHTGYTATLAKEIADLIGGSLFQIQPVDDYPEDYRATVDRYKEETAKHLRPAVTGSVRDMDQYDVLFVGFPNWGGDLPYIVYSFLEIGRAHV